MSKSFLLLENCVLLKLLFIDSELIFKPQFEAGRKEVARGKGVVRDPEVHQKVLLDVLTFSVDEGFQIKGLIRSPVLGPKGNVEFLVWLHYSEIINPPEISVVDLVSEVIVID